MPRFGHSSVVGCFVICWVGSVGSGDVLVPFSVLCVYLWCILICGCTLFTVFFCRCIGGGVVSVLVVLCREW